MNFRWLPLCLAVTALAAVAQAQPSISTTAIPPAMVGGAYTRPVAARGGTPPYTFFAAGLPAGLAISANGVVFGIPETAGAATVTITVRDSENFSANRPFTLSVVPAIEITASTLPDGIVGQTYVQALAVTGGSPPYTYSVLGAPPGMGVGPQGNFGGNPTSPGVFGVVITVEDAQKNLRFKVFTVTIAPALRFTTEALSNALNGAAYQLQLAAMGGRAPYTFLARDLPAGLTMSAAGLISGAPSANGSFTPGFAVTDSQGRQATRQFPMIVRAGLILTTAALPLAAVGQPYSRNVTAAGGSPPYNFSATGLPSGLTLSAGGALGGSPATAGSFSFTVNVTDAQQMATSAQYTLLAVTVPAITTAELFPPSAAGIPFLQRLAASGGTAPYTYALANGTQAPPGLSLSASGMVSGVPTAAGGFQFEAAVTDANQNSSTRRFQMTVSAASQLLIAKPSGPIEFAAVLGGEPPSIQNISLTSGVESALRTYLTVDDGNGGPAPSWLRLQITPVNGLTPGLVKVGVVSPGLAAGSYSARIRAGVAAVGVNALAHEIPVRLTITDTPPRPAVVPNLLRFSSRSSTPRVQELSFLMRNLGGGGPIPISLEVAGKSAWVANVETSSGTVRPGAPARVTVTVNTAGLAAGSYRDAVRVSSPIGAYEVPLVLTVFQPGPILFVAQDGVRFTTREGLDVPRAKPILVRNVGDPGTSLTWTAQVIRGADVVTLLSPFGTSTPNAPGSFGIRLSPTAVNSPGAKSALIQVSDPGAQFSPQFVTVVANIEAASTPVAPELEPAGLGFIATTGAKAPAAQQVAVSASSVQPLPFSVTSSTDDGADWLMATPESGTTTTANPAAVSVSVAAGQLAPGIYNGAVNVGIADQVRAVNVTMVVTAAGVATAATAEAKSSGRHAANCASNAVAIVQTGLPGNFAVPAGWPSNLSAVVADGCGNSLPEATVVASFSNGDPPISLTADQQGSTFSASWQPGNAASPATVTIDAVSGSLKPARAELSGSVDPNATPSPSLVIAGLLNNLNAVVGAPLAPGTVTQVYGKNLTPTPASPSTVPLPTVFKGVEALVGGLSAPIYFISDTQLTIQVPSELKPGPHLAMLVANNQYSQPQPVSVVEAAPGILALADGILVAQHADGSLVNAVNPARAGEFLVAYLVGMGVTNPPVPSGTPAPSAPLSRSPSQVQLTIDGQTAEIIFAGLTPGGVGLYQINFRVPPAAKTGNLEVVFTQDGVKANSSKLVVAQ